MIFKKNYEKIIIHTLKKITMDKSINCETVIQRDLYIDSMGWLQFLILLEKKLKCSFDPGFLAGGNYETVGDLIAGIKGYINKNK